MIPRCQFCHGDLYERRPDGTLVPLVPLIASYQHRAYHVECYEKLQRVALRTGGQL